MSNEQDPMNEEQPLGVINPLDEEPLTAGDDLADRMPVNVVQGLRDEGMLDDEAAGQLGLTDPNTPAADGETPVEGQPAEGPPDAGPPLAYESLDQLLVDLRNELPPEVYGKLTSQYRELLQAQGAVKIMREDPRFALAWEASQATPSPQAQPQPVPPTQDPLSAVDPAEIDKALEAGQPVGKVILDLVNRLVKGQLLPEAVNAARQEATTVSTTQHNVHRTREDAANAIFRDFVTEFPVFNQNPQLAEATTRIYAQMGVNPDAAPEVKRVALNGAFMTACRHFRVNPFAQTPAPAAASPNPAPANPAAALPQRRRLLAAAQLARTGRTMGQPIQGGGNGRLKQVSSSREALQQALAMVGANIPVR